MPVVFNSLGMCVAAVMVMALLYVSTRSSVPKMPPSVYAVLYMYDTDGEERTHFYRSEAEAYQFAGRVAVCASESKSINLQYIRIKEVKL